MKINLLTRIKAIKEFTDNVLSRATIIIVLLMLPGCRSYRHQQGMKTATQ